MVNGTGDPRESASMRRSSWNLLLIPGAIGPLAILWVGSAWLLSRLYAARHPGVALAWFPDSLSGVLLAVAPFIAWIPISLVVANRLVALIPAARRALDSEAVRWNLPGRRVASSELMRMSRFVTPIALGVAVLVALI